jgi:catechol 2,3-dioxygenase-like lactoylglutathione lyase family enzyme
MTASKVTVRTALAGIALGAFLSLAGPASAQAPNMPSAPVPMSATVLLNVSDLDKSLDYYSRFLGFKVVDRIFLGRDSWEVILSFDGTDLNPSLGLISHGAKGPAIVQGAGFDRVSFFVPTATQVDEITNQVAAAGYKVVMKPATVAMPGGRTYRFSHFKDPDGYTVNLTYFDPKHKNPAKR